MVESPVINDLFRKYPSVFDDSTELKPMKGEPMVIRFRSDINLEPKKVFTARPTPIHQREDAKKEFERILSTELSKNKLNLQNGLVLQCLYRNRMVKGYDWLPIIVT